MSPLIKLIHIIRSLGCNLRDAVISINYSLRPFLKRNSGLQIMQEISLNLMR